MADSDRRRQIARPRIRRRLRLIALGLVLLPALALTLLVRAASEADREAGRREQRDRRERVRSAAEDLAARLGARADLFSLAEPEIFGLREAFEPLSLTRPVVIDGDCSDWRGVAAEAGPLCERPLARYARAELVQGDGRDYDPTDLSFEITAGTREAAEGQLYLFLRVRDDDLRVRRGRFGAGDQLRLLVELPWGSDARIGARFVTTLEPGGALTTYQVGSDWGRALAQEERLDWGDYRAPAYRRPYGVWRRSEVGYDVELRLPLRRFGERWPEARLGLAVVDVDVDVAVAPDADAAVDHAGSGLRRQAIWVVPQREGALRLAAPGAERFGRAFGELGIELRARRIAVLDARGRELFASFVREAPPDPALRERVALLLAERRRSAAASVLHPGVALAVAGVLGERGELAGFVVEADAGESAQPRLLAILRESPVLAAVLGGALLLLFALLWDAQRLSRRILALVDDVGADRDADDEIGELSRRLHDLVERVRADRSYLQRLPAILGHETLGPLGVVKMYLDDVETRGAAKDARYHAARRGLRAVEELIEDLREATSLEEALARGEPCEVDLVGFLEDYLLAYGDTKQARIQADLPTRQLRIRTLEGRLEQLLDKLLDNAVEFSDGEAVRVALDGDASEVRIRVENPGLPLPEGPAAEQLFEPMWSQRKRTSERHLGMGLYVARLIAEHHGGSLCGWNAEGGRVVFEVRLPLAPAS